MSIFPGNCARRKETVTDEECLGCFVRPEHFMLRAHAHDRRMNCVQTHIVAHELDLVQIGATDHDLEISPRIAVLAEKCAEYNRRLAAPIIRAEIDALDEDALRQIVAQAADVANQYPHDATARTLAHEIRAQAEHTRQHNERAFAEIDARNAGVDARAEVGEATPV